MNHAAATPKPVLLLGTALWGWTIDKNTAFALLDEFYAAGCREVDAAVNYPINKNPADFRASERILLEWIAAHQVRDLKVIIKVGSLDNLYSPDANLTKSFLLLNLDDYRFRLGSNLDTFMIHWDNRADTAAIEDTLEALAEARRAGLRIGLSGIKRPELYAQLNQKPEFQFDFRIEIKHNVLYSDYARYAAFHGCKRFLAYGIHAGGLKLNPAAYREDSSLKVRGGQIHALPPAAEKIRQWLEEDPAAPDFHRLAMLYAAYNPDMQGIIIGPSSVEQLRQSLQVAASFHAERDGAWYRKLVALLSDKE